MWRGSDERHYTHCASIEKILSVDELPDVLAHIKVGTWKRRINESEERFSVPDVRGEVRKLRKYVILIDKQLNRIMFELRNGATISIADRLNIHSMLWMPKE